jgi:hypothetical protein
MTDETYGTPAGQEEVNALRARQGKNAMRLQQLGQPPLNLGIGLDSIVLVRLNMLLDMLLGAPDGGGATSERVAYELEFEEQMDKKLSEMEVEAQSMSARAQLLQGTGGVPPEILRQIKR